MSETAATRGLLDTSVVIDLGEIDPDQLPEAVAISAVTLAELAMGPRESDLFCAVERTQAHLSIR